VVERPGAATRSIRCREPELAYGVQFFDAAVFDAADPPGAVVQYEWGRGALARLYPNGAWEGVTVLGDVGVRAVTRDEATTRGILGSAHVVEGADENGCSPRLTAVTVTGADLMSVCRYGADGWLVESERLSGSESAQAWQALTSAPAPSPEAGCQGPGPSAAGEVVVMTLGATEFRVAWGDPCDEGPTGRPGNRGVFVGDERLDLTAEVMYWALSPGWSGVVDGSVPLPDDFRR
jgi:hypothetical protein